MKTFIKQPTIFQNTRFRTLCVWMVAFLVLGAILTVPSIHKVQAVSECTTTADGDWSESIWTCGTPSALDNVVIHHMVTLNTDATVASLTIESDGVDGTYIGSLQFLGSNTLSIAGNLDVNLGTIDPGTGTVEFLAGDQIINTHDQWADFYNFTKITAGSLTVAPSTIAGQVGGGGIHVLEKLTLAGTASTKLVLKSTASPSRWQVWFEGSAAVDYVDVMDSASVAGGITAVHGIDSGNNSGWLFGGNSVTSVTLSSSKKPAVLNQEVVFTATILPNNAQGTVTFMEDGGEISACEDIPVILGKASCPVTFTQLGSEILTAQFHATDTYENSISNSINQVTLGGILYLPSVRR